MKKITYLLIMLLAINFSYGQTMLAQFDFENPGGYTTTIPEFTDYVSPGTGTDGRDYFLRTDGSNTRAQNYANIQGSYYFTAQDIDGEGATLPVSLLINNINISGYSNLEFRVHLAEDDVPNPANMHWDAADYVHFNYDIDNSGFAQLLWIENDGSTFNSAPFIDTDGDGDGDGIEVTNTFSQFTQNIAVTGDLLDIEIIFSLNANDEDIAVDNIEIWGTLIPCNPSVTWDGTTSTWSNANVGPDINTTATINGNYDTLTYGPFSACSLTINSGFNLRVNDGDYLEIQNDVTVDGELFVEAQGNFIQHNDSAIFTDNSTNGVLVRKTKIVQNKFVYTYWSSPIVDETIENVFSTVPADKRFSFNAANFVDMWEEIGNTGTFLANPGVDDIDDDGNDWEYASGTLTPGVGYAMRTNTFGIAFPRQENFTFRGAFNNGIVTVPLVNNSGGIYNDWNLIGNPYPCAIDADQFFTVNAGLVDAIYLWDQFTAPSTAASGNEGYNFSGADYAMINGAGGVSVGASSTIPNRFVPSGQGFFVEALNSGTITFNNSMRSITNDNSQFFKTNESKKGTTNEADKLWINLTSDNGASNQVLISYIDGSSNTNDGSFYDLKRPVSTGNKILFYSLIENDTGKFAIQGKAPSDINENEIIKLGFQTSIGVATLYNLSIVQFQGAFLNGNTIYIKDNLLNTLHNLSASDYTFTSEVGEFNERFEIVFNANALSIEDISTNANTLKIVELQDDRVQFTTSSSIKTVRIFDLLGRQLYAFKGQKNSETYTLSNLSSTIYIAKVELLNGATITKKAFKK